MTEPVAYMYEDHVFNTEKEAVLFKKEFDRYKHDGMLKHVILPLFTADEISDIYKQNKRVKMTQAEFETFKNIKQKNNLLSDALNSTAFFGDEKQQSEQQIEFANLFINLDLDNPEETIEIVPDMKWFVRSKKRDDEGDFEFISGIETPDAWGYSKHHNGVNDPRACAYAFDTKEEAEKWTNPLTEAVQLPVE